jgi:hypothetical protein
LLIACLGMLAVTAEPASAFFSFHATIQHCRQTVGRPTVMACMSSAGITRERDRDRALAACRLKASPRVRACVQRAMIAAFGWPKVENVIEHCRQIVGRPTVNACMTSGGANPRAMPDLMRCQAQAQPLVRACVRRTLGNAG